MADPAENPSKPSRRRSWLMLGGLVVAHAAFNVLFDPFRGQRLFAMGVIFVQPMLFASWVVVGPAPATKRVPLTIGALVVVVFASGVGKANSFPANSLPMALAFFVVSTVVMLIVARLTRSKIGNTYRTTGTAVPLNQFSLKYLLALMTICAALLGLWRALALGQEWPPPPTGGKLISEIVSRMGLIMLALLPSLIAPFMVVSRQPRPGVLLTIPFLWAGLTWLAVEAIVALHKPPWWEVVRDVVLLQLGAGTAGLLSALALRLSGYRLLSRRSITP